MIELGLDKDERTIMVNTMILEKLPEDNYTVLKYLTQFLAKVRSFEIKILEFGRFQLLQLPLFKYHNAAFIISAVNVK